MDFLITYIMISILKNKYDIKLDWSPNLSMTDERRLSFKICEIIFMAKSIFFLLLIKARLL